MLGISWTFGISLFAVSIVVGVYIGTVVIARTCGFSIPLSMFFAAYAMYVYITLPFMPVKKPKVREAKKPRAKMSTKINMFIRRAITFCAEYPHIMNTCFTDLAERKKLSSNTRGYQNVKVQRGIMKREYVNAIRNCA